MNNPNKLIITGATRGIGLAILKRFLTSGFDAAFCGTKTDLVQEVSQSLKIEFPNARILGLTASLDIKEEAIAFSQKAIEFLCGCTILVNNAGTFLPGSVLQEEDGVLEKLFSVNVSSAYHVSRTIIPQMPDNQRSHVFNMCSIASLVAYPNGGSYCISKFAMLALSKLLREELKPRGICVTAVMPGATLTDSWANSGFPESRFVKPENIAEVMHTTWQCNENACTEELLIRPVAGDI